MYVCVQEAAVCIQKHIRGHLARRRALYGDLVMRAVIPIQRAWRLYLNYCRTKELVEERLADTRQQFAQLQAKFVREWREIQQGPRVIVHIASCSLDDADQRMSMHNFRVRQNSQLSRLCDLADPNVEVVLVVPFRLPEDILGYYAKLLAVGGVDSPEKRHRVVVPEYAPVSAPPSPPTHYSCELGSLDPVHCLAATFGFWVSHTRRGKCRASRPRRQKP